MSPGLDNKQRAQAADLMSDHGLNKCSDCCLVPTCPQCGPCADHDETTELAAALAWAKDNNIDVTNGRT